MFFPDRAFPHVDKPESETQSSSYWKTGYGTRVFEAAAGASVHRGLGCFFLGLSFEFREGLWRRWIIVYGRTLCGAYTLRCAIAVDLLRGLAPWALASIWPVMALSCSVHEMSEIAK
jgi:hypothetical protein